MAPRQAGIEDRARRLARRAADELALDRAGRVVRRADPAAAGVRGPVADLTALAALQLRRQARRAAAATAADALSTPARGAGSMRATRPA